MGLVSCSQPMKEADSRKDPKVGKVEIDTRYLAGLQARSTGPQARTVTNAPPELSTTHTKAASFAFKQPRQYQPIFDQVYEDFQGVWIGDFNGDGKSDVLANGHASQYFKMYLMSQLPDGSLSSPAIYQKSSAILVDDFNEDGFSDIFLLEFDSINVVQKPTVLLSNGKGGLEKRLAFQAPPELYGYAWVSMDLDGDGHLDLVHALSDSVDADGRLCESYCFGYVAWFGTGKGFFHRSQHVYLGVQGAVSELHAIDLNDDGRKDLVMPLRGFLSGSVLVSYVLPTGGTSSPRLLHPGYGVGGFLTFGDINGDGITDSILTPAAQSQPPEIRLRALNNTFGAPGYLARKPLHPGLILVDDFDGDRRPDLISTQIIDFGAVGLAYYRHSNGNLDSPVYTHFPPLTSTPPFNHEYMKAGDINGDGCKDVVFAGAGTGLLFFEGSNCIPAPHYRPNETRYVRRKPVGG